MADSAPQASIALLSKPRIELPRGACDSHFHLFGPLNLFPQFPDGDGQAREPTGTHFLEGWLKMQAALGLSRGLIVQSSRHAYSYEQMLHALNRYPDRLRGIARPHTSVTDHELEILTKAGVVGMRFVSGTAPVIDENMVARVHEHGWAPNYFFRGEEACEAWRRPILASPGKFLIEHCGYAPTGKGLDSTEFRFLLEALDTGRCWVKLTINFSKDSHNLPKMSPPFADTIPIVRKLIEHAPTRILWGSDWAHTRYDPWPDDATLIDTMLHWAPDEATRNRIFVENAEEALGFPPAR